MTSARPLPRAFTVPRRVRRAVAYVKSQLPDLDLKSLLPVSFAVNRGVVTCGNVSTPSLLVAEFAAADGTFGNVPVRVPSPLRSSSRGVGADSRTRSRARRSISTSRF
jgi:hypothetical protein